VSIKGILKVEARLYLFVKFLESMNHDSIFLPNKENSSKEAY